MKIGIVCADEARYRRIVRALKEGRFTKITPELERPNLDVVLTEAEIAADADRHPCTFTRGADGELAVQCGRHKEMQLRADAGIPSRDTLTIIFQDNPRPSEHADPGMARQECCNGRRPAPYPSR